MASSLKSLCSGCYNYCCDSSSNSASRSLIVGNHGAPNDQNGVAALLQPMMSRESSEALTCTDNKAVQIQRPLRRSAHTDSLSSSLFSLPPNETRADLPIHVHQLIADYAYGSSQQVNYEYDENDNFCLRVLEENEYETLSPCMKIFATMAARHLISVEIDGLQSSLSTIALLAEHAASSLRRLHIRVAGLTDEIFFLLARLRQLEMLCLDDCGLLHPAAIAPLVRCKKLNILIFNGADSFMTTQEGSSKPSSDTMAQLRRLVDKVKKLHVISCNKVTCFRKDIQTHHIPIDAQLEVHILDLKRLTLCTVDNNRIVWPSGHANALPAPTAAAAVSALASPDDDSGNPDWVAQKIEIENSRRVLKQEAVAKAAQEAQAKK